MSRSRINLKNVCMENNNYNIFKNSSTIINQFTHQEFNALLKLEPCTNELLNILLKLNQQFIRDENYEYAAVIRDYIAKQLD